MQTQSNGTTTDSAIAAATSAAASTDIAAGKNGLPWHEVEPTILAEVSTHEEARRCGERILKSHVPEKGAQHLLEAWDRMRERIGFVNWPSIPVHRKLSGLVGDTDDNLDHMFEDEPPELADLGADEEEPRGAEVAGTGGIEDV